MIYRTLSLGQLSAGMEHGWRAWHLKYSVRNISNDLQGQLSGILHQAVQLTWGMSKDAGAYGLSAVRMHDLG